MITKQVQCYHQRGLTLMELLIAMFLGLLVIGAIIQVFVHNRISNRNHNALAAMQENGRIAIETIARDLRNADYWGCVKTPQIVNHTISTAHEVSVNAAIVGTDGGDDGSDSLTVRGARLMAGVIPQPMANLSDNISVTGSPKALNDMHRQAIDEPNRAIMIADCQRADIFVASEDWNGTTIQRIMDDNNQMIRDCDIGHCLSERYRENASIYKPFTVSYSVVDNGLFKQVNGGPQMEIADNVDDLQVLYGVDTGLNPDNIADIYQRADQIIDFKRVVNIKVMLLFFSDDNLTESSSRTWFNWEQRYRDNNGASDKALKDERADRRLRKQFVTTINLRNRTG